MKKVLFNSINLLGDGLYACCVIKKYAELHPEDSIAVYTNKSFVTPIYGQIGVSLQIFTDMKFVEQYAPDTTFDLGAGAAGDYREMKLREGVDLHIAQALGQMVCGIDIPDFRPPYRATREYVAPDLEGAIFLSMFSASCASRKGGAPNKMLPWSKWLPVIQYLRQYKIPIRVLGGPDDYVSGLGFSEEEYLLGTSVNYTTNLFQKARLFVTLDNGLGHLAAIYNTPTLLFYPACLQVGFIAPVYNSNLAIMHVDPAVSPAAGILVGVRTLVPKLLAFQ